MHAVGLRGLLADEPGAMMAPIVLNVLAGVRLADTQLGCAGKWLKKDGRWMD